MEKLISEFSVGLFFWQTILFLALIFLLRRFAWKPTLKAINEREEFISDSLEKAQEAEQETRRLLEQNKTLLQQGQAERDQVMKDAKSTRDSIVREAANEAKAEAEKIREKAREDIKNETAKAIEQLKGEVASISFSIAQKVIEEKMTEADMQKDSIQRALKEISFN